MNEQMNSAQVLKRTVEKPYIKFTLTIESNSLGSIVDLFDDSRIHGGPAPDDHETPESLMADMKPEPQPAPEPVKDSEPEITMEQLKHLAVKVSERLNSKKPVGEAISKNFGCKMPELKPEQYKEAYKILEDLYNA